MEHKVMYTEMVWALDYFVESLRPYHILYIFFVLYEPFEQLKNIKFDMKTLWTQAKLPQKECVSLMFGALVVYFFFFIFLFIFILLLLISFIFGVDIRCSLSFRYYSIWSIVLFEIYYQCAWACVCVCILLSL